MKVMDPIKAIHIWNNVRVRKWCQNCIFFWVNNPFKAMIFHQIMSSHHPIEINRSKVLLARWNTYHALFFSSDHSISVVSHVTLTSAMYRLATILKNWVNWEKSLRWALMHDLDISIYACSYGTGSSFIWHAVQVTDSMEGVVGNTALLCLTDIARAHWPCVYGTTVDLRDCLGHLS